MVYLNSQILNHLKIYAFNIPSPLHAAPFFLAQAFKKSILIWFSR